jgi:hypothetical protein
MKNDTNNVHVLYGRTKFQQEAHLVTALLALALKKSDEAKGTTLSGSCLYSPTFAKLCMRSQVAAFQRIQQ